MGEGGGGRGVLRVMERGRGERGKGGRWEGMGGNVGVVMSGREEKEKK